MRATIWIAPSGFLLASGAVHAGPGFPLGHDDIVQAGQPVALALLTRGRGQLHLGRRMEDVVDAPEMP